MMTQMLNEFVIAMLILIPVFGIVFYILEKYERKRIIRLTDAHMEIERLINESLKDESSKIFKSKNNGQ